MKKLKKTISGVTLIELLIVIAIIALIMTLSINFKAISDSSFVKFDLEKLHSTILFLQMRAKTLSIEQKLVFKENGYSFGNETVKLSKNIYFATLDKAMGPPSKPVKLIEKPISFINNIIYFYKDGTISSGTVYLSNLKDCLYALSCDISQFCHLRRYKYHNGKWQAY